MILAFPAYKREWFILAHLAGAILAIILSARIAHADMSDTLRRSDNVRDHEQTIAYAPGWVIDSVLNNKAAADLNSNVRLHSDVETNGHLTAGSASEDKEVEKPELKKKTGQVAQKTEVLGRTDQLPANLVVNEDMTLPEGTYDFESITIAKGKTLTIAGKTSVVNCVTGIQGNGKVDMRGGRLTAGSVVGDALIIGSGGAVVIPETRDVGTVYVARSTNYWITIGSNYGFNKKTQTGSIQYEAMPNYKPTIKSDGIDQRDADINKTPSNVQMEGSIGDEMAVSVAADPGSLDNTGRDKKRDANKLDYGDGASAAEDDGRDLSASAKETLKQPQVVTGLIKYLRGKNDKDDFENKALEIAESVQEDSLGVDEDTAKEFQVIIRIVGAMNVIKNQLTESNFAAITQALANLIKERQTFYDDYLKTSGSVYERLEKLLGIDVENAPLPDALSAAPIMVVQVKRKMLVDSVLQSLEGKDRKEMTSGEREAMEINKYTLQPMREIYLGKLKMAMQGFTANVKNTIKDKSPASTISGDNDLKALFILDNQTSAGQDNR